MLTLASVFTTALSVMFVIVCAVMILVVLIQKSSGGGLSGAFGGAGGGGNAQAAFGAKVGDVLTWVTVVLFALFLGLAIMLTWNIRQDVAPSTQSAQAQQQQPQQTGQSPGGAGGGSDQNQGEPDQGLDPQAGDEPDQADADDQANTTPGEPQRGNQDANAGS